MAKKIENSPASLRFSPYAWAKLIFMRDCGKTEVGGYGICPADDLLYIEDIVFPEQSADSCFIELDEGALSKHMDNMFVNHDYQPNQCARIWIHTHPGNSATPSSYDDKIFNEKFGNQDWSVAFILARGGEYTCRLQINTDTLQHQSKLDVSVDWTAEFWGSDHEEWKKEYKNVTEIVYIAPKKTSKNKKTEKNTTTCQQSWVGKEDNYAGYFDHDEFYGHSPYADGYGRFEELEDGFLDENAGFPLNPEEHDVHEDLNGVEWIYIDEQWGWEELETILSTISEEDKEKLKKAQ